ncbi:MAG: NAD(P)/FAD-dependent oxidoreductase [Anaerolineales bacterium]|nr:NAD(P)/FAD-dependent oxidoreductase [Anaerolineales bacterium]
MVVGDLATNIDVLVLGAGPGGCTAALRAAQLGKEVVLVDPAPPGGSLSERILPTKILLDAAQQFWQIPSWTERGINLGKPELSWSQIQTWKNSQVEAARAEIKRQLDQQQVEVVAGQGWFLAENEARIEAEYGAKRYLFDYAVIAVGAEPAPWPNLPFDGERVLTPTQALALTEFPQSLSIVGADYLAAELATLFVKLGAAVHLLLPTGQRLLSEFDPAAGQIAQARLQELGVEIDSNLSGLKDLTGLIVVSAGLTPRPANLGLDKARVAAGADGFIQVNERQRTSNPAIYAAGAVTGALPLAHVANKQGQVAAENIAGRIAQFMPQAIPHVAYTDPPVATVGLTTAEAEAAGYHVSCSTFNLQHSTHSSAGGFIQLLAEQGSEVLLGVTITGPQADILIGEAALALEMGATLTDLAETLHPAAGEALARAAEAAMGILVHR